MENKNISKVKRGEIYLYDFGTNEGSIQNGLRPALVVQCDEGNMLLKRARKSARYGRTRRQTASGSVPPSRSAMSRTHRIRRTGW